MSCSYNGLTLMQLFLEGFTRLHPKLSRTCLFFPLHNVLWEHHHHNLAVPTQASPCAHCSHRFWVCQVCWQYLTGLPPLSSGFCQFSLQLSFVTHVTSKGPFGFSGGPKIFTSTVASSSPCSLEA
uniref:Uncharacterized protein n=1 Tax=Glossina palpalis gambiensis TaxID=67801 RepID=A0A1B0BWS9_9MUSC